MRCPDADAARSPPADAAGLLYMGRDVIAAVVTAFGELAQVVQGADPADKADIYAQLRLTLTNQNRGATSGSSH